MGDRDALGWPEESCERESWTLGLGDWVQGDGAVATRRDEVGGSSLFARSVRRRHDGILSKGHFYRRIVDPTEWSSLAPGQMFVAALSSSRGK